jgi:tetratricopeptide (TPR) repeat protein
VPARSADTQAVQRSIVLACAVLTLGCEGALSSENQPSIVPITASSDVPAQIRALRVRVEEDIAIVTEGDADRALGDHLKSAVQSELGQAGLTVVRGTDKAFDLALRIDTRVTGAVYFLRGHVGLTAENSGAAVALVTTDDEFHKNSDFPTTMAHKAVTALLHSAALADFAEKRERRRAFVAAKTAAPAQNTSAKTPLTATAEAKAHYNRGTSVYNLGRFRDALAEYEAAYMAVQDPPFLFDIAQCHRKLGNNKEALGFYRSYLRVAPNASNRAEVQKRISELDRDARASR